MSQKKKSLFDRAIDALTNRDEREAAEAARSEALVDAVPRQADTRARIVTERATAEKATADNDVQEEAASTGVVTNHVKPSGEGAVAERTATPARGVVTVRSLRIRADHSTASEVVGGLVKGDEVTILSIWSDGRDTWVKLDTGWAAMVYRGETYIQPA